MRVATSSGRSEQISSAPMFDALIVAVRSSNAFCEFPLTVPIASRSPLAWCRTKRSDAVEDSRLRATRSVRHWLPAEPAVWPTISLQYTYFVLHDTAPAPLPRPPPIAAGFTPFAGVDVAAALIEVTANSDTSSAELMKAGLCTPLLLSLSTMK